ncbi:MAG: hypothetical protein PHZ03_07315 [Syntrophomonas sp.]|nr:hypothetical protein [Syntrophomonas sp.]
MNSLPVLWGSPNGIEIPTEACGINDVAPYIIALNGAEVQKIMVAFEMRAYDMGIEYVWKRTTSILRDKVLSFGQDFVLEMLGRPNEDFENGDSISDVEVISLASDLGIINKTARMQFLHNHEAIQHFSSKYARDNGEEMDITIAQTCAKSCIKYVLGLSDEVFKFSFTNFRERLKQSFVNDDEMLDSLINNPYFYKRTTIRTLLNLVKSSKGGELDNVLANMNLIIPGIWDDLLSEDRYPIGVAYASAVNEGQTKLVKAFKSLLLKVRGFDYVPENLRSNTFIKAAEDLLRVHHEYDNFYNEPKPAKYLLSLGTSIPGPAVGKCMTAVLACKLGNSYGKSKDAQKYLDQILNGISTDRWEYYLNSVLPGDQEILFKLRGNGEPVERWCTIVNQYKLDVMNCSNTQVTKMIGASKANKDSFVSKIANGIYDALG